MAIKVGMVSLGCPKNQVDAEILLGFLVEEGFQIVNDATEADAVIINTCGFIQSAKEESIEAILEYCGLKEEGTLQCVVVTGCLAERYQEEIGSELPEVDVVLGLGENQDIGAAIRQSLSDGDAIYAFGDKYNLPLSGERVLTTAPWMAYLKIAEGCDNFCTYCAIPMIRGRFRSRPMEDLISEATALAEAGVKELVLVAQDTGYYGTDLYGEARLAELLEELNTVPGLEWIRVLYCYPERITDRLLQAFQNCEKIVPYLDVPMQHCNGDVLKRMNRQGNREWLTELIHHVREEVPSITLRTTFIAGFPGETEEQFNELFDFVTDMQFDRMGCFAYSQEENTPAAKLPEQLPEEEKIRRANIVSELQYGINMRKADALKGQKMVVVVEGFDEDELLWFGRSTADAPEIDCQVFFYTEEEVFLGEFVEVEIIDTIDLDPMGKMTRRLIQKGEQQ